MKLRIFVYGTLKRGGRFSHYLAGQHFIGEARTEPRYRMVDCGGYPGMFPVAGNGVSVRGEVWDVDEFCRARLDELEDVAGGEYEFVEGQLLAPFDAQEVMTYLYLRAVAHLPDAGDDWPASPAGDKK